jgi:hypothetical protein
MGRKVRTPKERVIEDADATVARDRTENDRIATVSRKVCVQVWPTLLISRPSEYPALVSVPMVATPSPQNEMPIRLRYQVLHRLGGT